MSEKKHKAKRKLYFRILKKLMTGRYKEPRFIYLGEPFDNGALILSNHEGTDSPMSLEIYCDKPIRMWGAAEMNSGLIKLYKCQVLVAYGVAMVSLGVEVATLRIQHIEVVDMSVEVLEEC